MGYIKLEATLPAELLSRLTGIARASELALAFACLFVAIFLSLRYPKYGGMLMLPALYLCNVVLYYLYYYSHAPFDAHEIATINLWSLTLRLQVVLSLLGGGLVWLCQRKN